MLLTSQVLETRLTAEVINEEKIKDYSSSA